MCPKDWCFSAGISPIPISLPPLNSSSLNPKWPHQSAQPTPSLLIKSTKDLRNTCSATIISAVTGHQLRSLEQSILRCLNIQVNLDIEACALQPFTFLHVAVQDHHHVQEHHHFHWPPFHTDGQARAVVIYFTLCDQVRQVPQYSLGKDLTLDSTVLRKKDCCPLPSTPTKSLCFDALS